MSRMLGHPAPAALARLRAGLPSGRHERRLSAHIARCPDCARVCAQLDAVGALLREAPRTSLPTVIERRILTAIAAEATRRLPRPAGTSRRARQGSFPRLLPIAVAPAIAGALAVCAGFGYFFLTTRTYPPSPVPAAAPPASGTAQPAPPVGAASGASPVTAFLVTDSNITYQKSTLRAQVRHTLAVQGAGPAVQPLARSSTPTTVATASPGGTGVGPGPGSPQITPSEALVGCVFHLTGDVAPKFVDRATYQAEQVYVIAVADEAWIVGMGCTAARPTLITSVQL